MRLKPFAFKSQDAPEFIATIIKSFFITPRHYPVRGGEWVGFGIKGEIKRSEIFGNNLRLEIVGYRLGEGDPFLDKVDDAGQIGFGEFLGTGLRRAAQIILTPNGTRTHVQFELDDADLEPLFRDLERIIAPKIAARLTTDQKIALVGLGFAILACIGTYFAFPQVQTAIQNFLGGAMPTTTPIHATPIPTPR